MRHTIKLLSFLASTVTMSVGFYDLYKHFPLFSSFLNQYLHSAAEWFEQTIMLRMTILMGYIIYFSGPFALVFNFFMSSTVLLRLVNGLMYPILYPFKLLRATITLSYELLLPLIRLVRIITSAGLSFVRTLIAFPA